MRHPDREVTKQHLQYLFDRARSRGGNGLGRDGTHNEEHDGAVERERG